MSSESISAMIRQTTNPIHQAGLIAHGACTVEDAEWILEHFSEHPAVWRGLISRSDCTEDWIKRASRIPDAGVLGALVAHRLGSTELNAWIRDYSLELANESIGIERAGFLHVHGYAAKCAHIHPAI